MISTWLTRTLDIKYPVILAPMFLVSNKKMLIEAYHSGIIGCIPALNFRIPKEFDEALCELKKECNGKFGVNLITNRSNIHLKDQLASLVKTPPAFVITSLGSPEETIRMLKPLGVKIFCDVVDLHYAQKVEKIGADALIAVNSSAGGHAGNISASILIPMLKNNCNLPVISAGGIGTGVGLFSTLALGADGVSIGSPFIATLESEVSREYKQAIINYGAENIVMTSKISGSPCSVIETPYLKKIGTKQNFLESFLSKNKNAKKFIKMLTYYKGMKALEKAAFAATYKTVWVAGPSIEFVKKIETVRSLVERLFSEYEKAREELCLKTQNR